MRFAFLGQDDDTRQLEQALAGSADQELVSVPFTEWEILLGRNDLDALVIAREGDAATRDDALRKLAASGTPLVVSHPAADVLTAYELEMIRRESHGTIFPFAAEWNHPAWQELVDSCVPGNPAAIGRLQRIVFDRQLVDRSRSTTRIQLAQDIEILRRLLGNISSVHAVGVPRTDDSWNWLTVHFTNEEGCAATWNLTDPGSSHPTRIQVTGEDGTVAVTIHRPSHEWTLQDRTGELHSYPAWNPGTALVATLLQERQAGLAEMSWNDACLDLEIVDTAEKSLRRKRSLDLTTAGRTEEKTFKGFMAAGGCLILLLILLAFLGLALWDGFRAPFRDPVTMENVGGGAAMREPSDRWPLWARLWPVYPLVAFLLLQLLLFVTRASPAEPSGEN